jgi:Zn-dependent peptidase ImmA (M78 family)
MAKSEVPINPDVLAWAMEQAGIDDLDLAIRCKTSEDAVRAWRTGGAKPGKTEFKRLVGRLRRPSVIYFLPEPPADDPVVSAFRHPPGTTPDRDLIDREQTSIRTAERIQRVARWTRERTGHKIAPWPKLAGLEPAEAARQARNFLDWGVGDQIGAQSASQVAAELRGRIEDRGAFVLQLQLSQDGCRGFSLEDELAPVVAINSAYTIPARVFSMVHEVGHLVLHQPAFCLRLPDGSQTERWCERFAAAFLMPRKEFSAYVEKRFGESAVTDIDEVKSIANRFRVSLRAAALRVEQLGLGAEGLYDEVDAKADFKGSGGFSTDNTTPAVRLREWGDGYARTISDAEGQGVLSPADALEYLNVSGGQYREIRARIAGAEGHGGE